MVRAAKDRISEWRHFFPDLREPAFALVITKRAFGNVFDRCVGDVVTEHGIIGRDVFCANHAPAKGRSAFPRKNKFDACLQ